MLEEVEFLFDNQLIAAVEKLIRSAKNKLMLISPFIDLDARITDALNEKKSLPNFDLWVLFGKNESNYFRSMKKDSLEFFRQFPKVEIRYNERLHAKFYQNDFEYIMTSLNLYDYSLANNIEVGVRSEFASKGLLGKAFDVTGSFIGQGMNKVKQDVLGMENRVGPIEKFQLIFETSELIYKTLPLMEDKQGLQGWMGAKTLQGFEVIVDTIGQSTTTMTTSPTPTTDKKNTSHTTINDVPNSGTTGKWVSASNLSKALGVSIKDITDLMQQKGLIDGNKITELGRNRGLLMKTYMGNSYIAYPDNLAELKELR